MCVAERDAAAGKAIYMVSDGTGWTAEHAVNAALGQFEHCFVDRGCAVNTHLISMVNISPCLHILFIYFFLLEVRSVHGVLTADRVSSYHGRCPVLSSNYRISQLGALQFLDCSCKF